MSDQAPPPPEAAEADHANSALYELEVGIADELGVPVDAYRGYLEVCSAVDRYVDRHHHPSSSAQSESRQLKFDGDGPDALRREATTVVQAALELHGTSEAPIARRPDRVADQVERILIAGLALKAGLVRMPRVRDAEANRAPEGGTGHER